MSSLLLFRHGQASFGNADYDQLTALGVSQAQATGAFFRQRSWGFSDVLSGPKRRHQDSTLALIETFSAGTPWRVEPALEELAEGHEILAAAQAHFGVSLTAPGVARHIQLRYYNDMMQAWGEGLAPMGSKPTAQAFRQNVSRWLRKLVDEPQSGRSILAVTSAGVIGAVVCEVLGTNTSHMMDYVRVLRNASLTEIVFSRGRASLMSFNTVDHLPTELVSAI